jgi:hypothetical protein
MSRSLLLGKNGDLLSVLPCLQAEYNETGKRPTLIVSKDYSALPKVLPWLNVEEFDGSFEFIGNALRWAKKFGKVDFIPQMSGVGYPQPARRHPSFQYSQWDRMGRLHQWNELTLELPRIASTPIPKQPFILLADHSQSSPFSAIEDLHSALFKEFPSHSIVRCSSIRLPLLLGFLSLMDAAELIVSIDTSFLHLSRATKTPVIALATDVPGGWWGSAYHPRMSLHVRYSDYPLRKSELLWTAKKILTLGNQKEKLTPA